jgi:hypothetical protein
MKITQIDNFDQTITLAAGEHRPVSQMGRYFILMSNDLVTELQIAFGDSQHYTPWPVLFDQTFRQPDDFFDKVRFYNPAAVPMTIHYKISTELIGNKQAKVTASVTMPVDDTSNGTESPASIIVIPRAGYLIDAAAAVDVGGGVVGIPVATHPFVAGQSVTITGTVNYDGAYVVLAGGGLNQVNITAAYVAEVFDGVDDTIALTVAQSIPADATQKELHITNWDSTFEVVWGDSTVLGEAAVWGVGVRGTLIAPRSTYILPCTDEIFLTCAEAAGKDGCPVSWTRKTKT